MVRAETALFHWRVHELKANRLAEEARSYVEPLLAGPSFTIIRDEASHAKAMAERAGAEYERDCDEVLVGCALDADAKEADAFGKACSLRDEP